MNTQEGFAVMEQARFYGRAQWQAAAKKFGAVAKTLTEIATMGREFVTHLVEGLKGA